MKTKSLGAIVILLILTESFSSCNKENFADYYSENFRLEKILHYSNSTSREPVRGVEYTYDEAENMVKESFYDYQPKTTLWTYKEYKYSENKKVKEKIYDGEVGNLRLGLYIDYIYVGDKLVKEETYRGFDNSLANAMNYEYDERGNLVRQYKYEPNYGVTSDMIYSYNHQDQLILEENTVFGVANLKYLRHTYDDSGREIKSEYLYENWDLYQYVEKIYNGTNKSPERDLYYDKDGNQILKYQHFYDDWGNLVETILNDECSLFKRKYNHELLIEEIHYSFNWGCSESGMSKYEYKKR